MTATTDRCPGCHGSGIEMSGVTYAGMSEYVGCHECGPECPDDCGCRASDATERPKSVAPRHLGATQSPDGSQGATEHVMTTSWHEGSPYSCARPGCPAGCDRNDPTTEAPSDVRLTAERDGAEKAEAEVARLAEEATVSAALLETEIAKREAAEMRANRATADLDALESEDRRQDVQAKHWREVLRIRRELDGIRREMNDVTEIIAEALGYRPSGLPLDGWPHLSTTGDHTPTSLAAEAAGVLAKASRLREGIEALAGDWEGEAGDAPTKAAQRMLDYHTNALLALLAEGGE